MRQERGKMTIREMTKEDCEAVWELQKTCFTVPWSLDSIRAMFGTPGYLSLIAMEDGILTGYAGIKQVLDEADITNVAVHPDRRRQGVRRIFLEVRDSNEAAQRLYAQAGFQMVDRRKHYYEKPVEDACIMLWDAGDGASNSY